MPGPMRLFVRIDGGSPFVLVLQDNLLPEHYKEIAVKYYREHSYAARKAKKTSAANSAKEGKDGSKGGDDCGLLLMRRVVFKNKDQLLDFKKRRTNTTLGDAVTTTAVNTAAADASAVDAAVTREAKTINGGTVDSIRASMTVTNPPSQSLVSRSETLLLLRSATIDTIVKKLTDPLSTVASSHSSMPLVDIFLLTYRGFASAQEVLTKLCARYDVPWLRKEGPDSDDSLRSPLDAKYYAELHRAVKRSVFGVLERWVELYPYDFSNDITFARLQRWIREKVDKDGAPTRIMAILKAADRTALPDRLPHPLPGTFNPSLSPTTVLTTFAPREIANQLTHLTLHVHNAIHPVELLGKQWENPDSAAYIPNFFAYREYFTKVVNWCTYAVVAEKNISTRTNNLGVLLLVCEELLRMNNWDALVAVHTGITDPSVSRLGSTISSMPQEQLATIDKLNELLGSKAASKALKSAMHSSERPHFPSIVIHLRDLVLIEDMPAHVEGQAGTTTSNTTSQPQQHVNWLRCVNQYNLVTHLLDGKGSDAGRFGKPNEELQGVFAHWRPVENTVLRQLSHDLD